MKKLISVHVGGGKVQQVADLMARAGAGGGGEKKQVRSELRPTSMLVAFVPFTAVEADAAAHRVALESVRLRVGISERDVVIAATDTAYVQYAIYDDASLSHVTVVNDKPHVISLAASDMNKMNKLTKLPIVPAFHSTVESVTKLNAWLRGSGTRLEGVTSAAKALNEKPYLPLKPNPTRFLDRVLGTHQTLKMNGALSLIYTAGSGGAVGGGIPGKAIKFLSDAAFAEFAPLYINMQASRPIMLKVDAALFAHYAAECAHGRRERVRVLAEP
jgi:hypothetical protein